MTKFARSLICMVLLGSWAVVSQPALGAAPAEQEASYNIPIALMDFGEDHIVIRLNSSTLWEGDVTGRTEAEQQFGMSKSITARLAPCDSLSVKGRHVTIARNFCVTSKTRVVLVEGDWRPKGRRNPYIEVRDRPLTLD
ncbi:hypothetical protein [Phenylobacterium montanum]|uniref:Uncharacterized protein n=1 Tax=Phenylobacterium montanum TaxID=2823693 RepID=A0A975G2E0_9CAUL|nr:hypothetical protein [Caulobacter sp. S6]QUD89878.1 hypothetical protein KCG34_08450 [Caulobacter sp. S6]